jgi:type III secretory pathway component EscS
MQENIILTSLIKLICMYLTWFVMSSWWERRLWESS